MNEKNKYVKDMFDKNDIQYSQVELDYQEGRRAIISHKTEKQWNNLEKRLNKDIMKFLEKNKHNNFDIRDFMKIKNISINYPINIFISKRGIGKSVSSKKLCEDYANQRKGHFIWLRSTQAEADKFVSDESTQWFKDNGWFCMKATGIIFRSWKHCFNFKKKNKITDTGERNIYKMRGKEKDRFLNSLSFEKIDEEVVGYVEGLYSAAKRNRSMEKRGVRLILYDEFQLWNKGEDQLLLLCDYMETVVRRKQNFNVILHANYQNANNPLITNLKTSHNRIDFNKITGSIIINIPKDYFNVYKSYTTVAERLSYANKNTFSSRSGDSYDKLNNKQVILVPNDINKKVKPYAFVMWETSTFNIFSYGNDSLLICDSLWVPLIRTKKVHKVVFTHKDWLKNQNYILLSDDNISNLIHLQRNKKIFYSSDFIHDLFIDILNRVSKSNDKINEDKIDINTV